MDFRLLLTSVLLGVTALAAACSDDDKPCDPDQKYESRVCKAIPPEAGPIDEDAATDGPTEVPAVWGKACNMPGDAAVDCVGASNFCVARPGATEGYCSAIGCDADPGICPVGWSCFPIPGVIAWCAKP